MSPVHREGPEQHLELHTKDGRTATVHLPEELRRQLGPTRAETRARPRPEEPGDPRPSSLRAAPPYGGA
jgi:hypothetical protein